MKQELRSCSARTVAQHNEQVRLQAELERQDAEREAATQAADTLRDANNSLQTRLTDSLGRVKDLTGQLAESEASFRAEIETQKRLVDAMDAREVERSRRMEEMEQEWEQRKADLITREDDAREVVERERRRGDDLERRLNEMREVTERMGASAATEDGLVLRGTGDRAATPGAAPSSPFGRLGMMMLSPAAALASRMQKSGMSITEVYAQLVACQDELAKERAEVVRLSESLAQILAEIEDRVSLSVECHLPRADTDLVGAGAQGAEGRI